MKNTLKKQLEKNLNEKLPDLIKKLQSGDSSVQDEFAVLVLPYIKLLITTYGKTIECPESEAGWVTMKLLNKINNLDLNKPIVGYITTTTNNYCIDTYRAQRRKKRTRGIAENTATTTIEYTPEFYIDNNYSPDQSEILKYFYVDNLDIKNIAELTGETRKYVQSVVNDFKEIEYNDERIPTN